MPAINANTENSNSPVYPVNGKSPTSWGSQYDPSVRARIVNDIANGLLTIDEMSEMINVGKSYIRDWGRSYRSDAFGKPRSRPAKKNNYHNYGQGLTVEEKMEIARSVISGEISIKAASIKYKVFPSKIEYWVNSKRYNPGATRMHVANHQPAAKTFPADRLANSPKHSRIVLDLLLNGSTEQALVVARAFLATI